MKLGVFFGTLLLVFSGVAGACPDGQYEQCTWGVCICLPNSGTLAKQSEQTFNPLPDMLDVLGATVRGDVVGLSRAVGSQVIKANCPTCDIIGQNIMDKPTKTFVEGLVGRGTLLYVTGVDPTLIFADALVTSATMIQLKNQPVPIIKTPVVAERGIKQFKVQAGNCMVISEENKVMAGWVDAPVLVDQADGSSWTYPKVDLKDGDSVEVFSSSECPALEGAPQRIVGHSKFTFRYSASALGVGEKTMRYFFVGDNADKSL